MTSIKLSELKKSWHYRLANTYGDYCHYGPKIQFCPYARQVLKGFLLVLFIIGIGSVVVAVTLEAPATFIMTVITGEFSQYYFFDTNQPVLWVISILIWCFVFLGMLVLAYKEVDERYDIPKIHLPKFLPANNKPKQPSFIGLWWESFHKKICPIITVEKDDG
jgi:hypothetical protein